MNKNLLFDGPDISKHNGVVNMKKIKEAADYKKAHGLSYEIQVDGCCGKSTYEIYGNAGAEMLVMGSGLFGLDQDLSKAIAIMQKDLREAEKNIQR